MVWFHIILHSTTYVNFWSVTSCVEHLLYVYYLRHYLNHIYSFGIIALFPCTGFGIITLWPYFPYPTVCLVIRILLLLFKTNAREGQFTYVDRNTVRVMWRHVEWTPIRRFIYFNHKISLIFEYYVRGVFLIFCRYDVMYRIWTLFGSYFSFLYDITLNSEILRKLHHFTNWLNIVSEPHLVNVVILFMMSHWPQLFCVNSIILQIDLFIFYVGR